ncbi:MAG: hypothetical protein AB7O97_12910 [Planctomycetota bacterium]
MRSRTRTHRALFAAAALLLPVLLVLVTGLPRLLVVCSGPHCEARIEWAHIGERCCAPAPAAPAESMCCGHEGHGDPDHGPELRAGHDDCVDSALPFGYGPLPRGPHPAPAVAPAVDGAMAFLLPTPRTAHATTRHPPATGPPRPDPRTEHKATTVLLR